MILIKNVAVYAPEKIGVKDVLVAGTKIVKIEDKIENIFEDTKEIDGSEKILVPGFIDNHVHVTGGGGEAGFSSKAPEIKFGKLIEGAITTVIGLLGTDGATRSIENLVSKIYALKEQGLSAYGLTGSYRFPSNTLTGDVERDILFIDPILGVKISLSDHRSSNITNNELERLGTEARIAGMISKKAGVVVVHMGNGKKGLRPLFEIEEETDIPITVYRPTHINRKDSLIEEGFEYLKKGGYIDLTCGISDKNRSAKVIKRALENNIPKEKITVSSDGNGSYSTYDEDGNIKNIGVSSVSSLLEEFRELVHIGINIEEALPFFTTNVAKGYKFVEKMGIRENMDADLVLMDKNLELDTVMCRGKIFFENGTLLRDSYLEFD